MFKSLLIANRGEIACRIVRTARRMGIRTIAVYSEDDARSLHVKEADEAHLIGAARASESYLNSPRIIEVANAAGAEAVHPGYGFLSENADFAKACAKAGVIFVGPPVKAMRLMGRKDDAKAKMSAAGIPVVPGYDGADQRGDALLRQAKAIGFPVMIKAVAGGGGRGMRLVSEPDDFAAALEGARREAEAAFGDGAVLLEKAVLEPRHIEVQIFADAHGNAVHLFERDCSLQRRHQKVIEEAPAPHLSPAVQSAIAESALKATRAVGYRGAGTVEFLIEGGGRDAADPFYFLEMNTRLQVEHPVTEAITGYDLVEWQLRIAAGERLPASQGQIPCNGAAIEVRLYAEDPAHDFRPSAARIAALEWPEGNRVRIDTGVREGDSVSPHYDTMIAKLIAHGPDRKAALDRLSRALNETVIAGPKTNLAFLKALISHKDVARGRYDTSLIDSQQARLVRAKISPAAIEAGAAALMKTTNARIEARRCTFSNETASPWSSADGFILGPRSDIGCTLLVDGDPREFSVRWTGGEVKLSLRPPAKRAANPALRIVRDGEGIFVLEDLLQAEIRPPETRQTKLDVDAAGGSVMSPLPGRVAKLYVEIGDRVQEGDRIAVLEAMKMEHVLHAPMSGTVEAIPIAPGEQIEQDVAVVVIMPGDPPGEET